MLVLDASQVRHSLPMPDAIAAMKRALVAISRGEVNMPVRTHLDFPDQNGTTLVMPAHVTTPEPGALSVKVVSVFGDNPARNLPRIMAAVTVYDPQTGQPVALLEGTTLTAIRTAAASAAATDVLARPDSHVLTIVGAGVQARTHIEAIGCVRPIRLVRICSRTRTRCEDLVGEMQDRVDSQFEIVDSVDQAVSGADIVCTVTTARIPLFSETAVTAGTHINAVGSYQPHVVEIPGPLVAAARVYVDHLESALAEAGDLLQPIRDGLIVKSHCRGEIGQVLDLRIQGRISPSDITLFKSVGNAAEDCLAADTAISNARESGQCTEIDW